MSRDEERDEKRDDDEDRSSDGAEADEGADEASSKDEASEGDAADSEKAESEKAEAKKADAPKAKGEASKAKGDSKRKAEPKAVSASEPARRAPEPGPAPSGGGATPVYVLGALIVGGAAGWFGRGGSVDATPTADAPAVVGSAAPQEGGTCTKWADEICAGAGAQSEGCAQAKGAVGLLTEKACTDALAHVPATMEKLKAARASCDELVTKICADIGKDTETCKMVTETTKRFPPKQCKEMLDNFGEVIAELRQLEKQNGPIAADVVAAQRAGDAPGFGPVDAKLAIVEYSDFECPFCTRAAGVVGKLKEKYGDKVRFVFRQYPLPMHRNAEIAAQASLEAHAQGKFWQLHDLLFANQRTLDRDKILALAKEAGMDVKKLEKALEDGTHAVAVQNDMKLGDQIGVSGTPTMIVGDKRVQNPTDFDAVAEIIDAELARLGN